jgi:predicted MFS family arabinose efflux permease
LYLRLSLLMALQWAVPGSLVPLYSLRLSRLCFDEMTVGACCATQAVASVVSSLVAGQVADRWVSAEKAMFACACAAGACLWLLADAQQPATVFVLTLVFWLVTGPMILLGTTVALAQLSQPQRQFGPIRTWGTVGWMLTVWLLGWWLARPDWLSDARDAVLGGPPYLALDDSPRLGAVVAFALAGYVLTLPPLPPPSRRSAAGARHWLAPLQALGLLSRDRGFLVYLLCVFAVCVTFPFSTQTLPLLLQDHLGIPEARVGPTLSLAQLTEVVFLFGLPLMLRCLGTRRTMGAGLAAWLIAMTVLALGRPTYLVIASLGLHGLYITGFLIAGQVYVNALASGDLRASVQGLLSCVNGLGLLLGNFLAGWLRRASGGDLPANFAVAAAVVGAAFVLFLVGFRQPEEVEGPASRPGS